jgi:sugar phosphate isomerase/epimerase
MKFSRRTFLQSSAALVAGAILPNGSGFGAAANPAPFEISLFTKHFIGLPYDRLAEVVAGLGFTGIEAPIRPGGHVEPTRVEEELPKLVEALKKCGVRITMLTSAINNKLPIWPQLDEIRPKLKDLVALSKEIGVLPCYQNHSGAKLVGAGIWDMALLMRDYKPGELAWAFDIMHATIEGSMSWPTEVALVQDHIGMAFFKNFAWEGKGHKPAPLGEGVVGKSYVDQLKVFGYQGPVCLHIEHLKGKLKDPDYLDSAVEATRKDLETLRSWLG